MKRATVVCNRNFTLNIRLQVPDDMTREELEEQLAHRPMKDWLETEIQRALASYIDRVDLASFALDWNDFFHDWEETNATVRPFNHVVISSRGGAAEPPPDVMELYLA